MLPVGNAPAARRTSQNVSEAHAALDGVLIGAGIVALLAGSRTGFWILVLTLIAAVIGQTVRRPQRVRGDENVCRDGSGSDRAGGVSMLEILCASCALSGPQNEVLNRPARPVLAG